MEIEFSLYDNSDGRHCLTLMVGNEETETFFEDLELQGGGYSLEGIVSALLKDSTIAGDANLEIGAEADNMWIYCQEKNTLRGIQKTVTESFLDRNKIEKIIRDSDGDIE